MFLSMLLCKDFIISSSIISDQIYSIKSRLPNQMNSLSSVKFLITLKQQSCRAGSQAVSEAGAGAGGDH